MIIGIDKGHAIKGVRGASGLLDEVNENRKVGNRLIEMLKAAGHKVVDCSVDESSNVNAQLRGIVEKANKQHLDIFVSLHFNSGGGRGTETFTYLNTNKATVEKAKKINDCIVASCNFINRGIKTANFYVLRETKAPAILVEICFVDSKEDKNKLNSEAVAKALFKGITGADYKANDKPAANNHKTMFRVVAGFYKEKHHAIDQQNILKKKGFDSFLVAHNNKGVEGFRVVCGTYSNKNNANEQINKLLKVGIDAYLVEI